MTVPKDKRPVIAERLRTARELAGLSQAQAAKILGLHRPSVSEMEAGRRRVSAEELSKLAEIYSVDMSWLMGEEQDSELGDERVRFAARELSKLKPDDLDKVMKVLHALRPRKGKGL